MEPDARYTVIGAVVLALAAAAVLAFLWLGRSGSASDYNYYTVYFQHQSLEGLQVGGNVNMRGITVGRVEQFELSRDDINRVKVRLRVSRNAPVRENTRAAVSRNVLTGIARINLETPNKPAPELVKVLPGERYPVIAEGSSNLDQIADTVNRLTDVAYSTLDNLNQVLDPANRQAFAELLVSLRDLSKNVEARLPLLDKSAASLDQTAAVFQQSARDLTRSAQAALAGVPPLTAQAEQALRDAREATREFTRATKALQADVSRSLAKLDSSTAGLARQADQTMDTGVLELRATASELRSSAEQMARALSRLQDPRAALVGPGQQQLGPGEQKP